MSDILYDRIYSCWLGKNIGGTLGAPVEGRTDFLDIKWYPKLPEGTAIPNDDLDLQLLNLHAAEQYGSRLSAADLAAEWCEHVYFPWDEYGEALASLRLGFLPPFAGGFDNHFTDCMGSPIRSDLWACACAGNPRAAAFFAWQDAVVDHAGGEGVWGEIFNAALGAISFNGGERAGLVREALGYLPESSRVYKAVADTLNLYESGAGYKEAREEILARHGRKNFTDAPQNIAFEVIGLLWGSDFEDVLLKTVNLGYDTDCTVATVGALLGIMYGRDFIPEKWSAPVGESICVSPQIRGFRPPADLDELTRRTLMLRGRISSSDETDFVVAPGDLLDMSSQRYTLPPGCRASEGVELRLFYDSSPAVSAEGEVSVTVHITNNTTWRWRMKLAVNCPDGFEASFKEGSCALEYEIELGAGESTKVGICLRPVGTPQRVNRFGISVTRINDGAYWTEYSIPFILLGANRWCLDGEEVFVAGNTVSFSRRTPDSVYVAEGTLYSAESRPTQIICASGSPLEVYLDGERIINSSEPQNFLPAYHRAPASQKATIMLSRGEHKVRVVLRSDSAPTFVFVTTAPKSVSEPGNYYAYIDNRMI